MSGFLYFEVVIIFVVTPTKPYLQISFHTCVCVSVHVCVCFLKERVRLSLVRKGHGKKLGKCENLVCFLILILGNRPEG